MYCIISEFSGLDILILELNGEGSMINGDTLSSFFCLITWLGRGTGLIILIYFHHNFKQSLNVSLRYEMLYFMKPFSMVPIGRLGHLGCGTVPTSLKLAWHSDPACRGHRPSVRYFGLWSLPAPPAAVPTPAPLPLLLGAAPLQAPPFLQ